MGTGQICPHPTASTDHGRGRTTATGVRHEDLRLLLNTPGSGGAGQDTARGTPEPVGWNRFQIEVADLTTTVRDLRLGGARFDGEIVGGRGGRQILVLDPAGNPVELFEPTGEPRPGA